MTMKSQIIDLMDKFPDAVIAKKVGCHRSYVRHVRGEVGAPKRSGGTPPIHSYERFRQLHNAGCNDHEIARRIGCSQFAVWSWRRKNNLPPV